MAGKKDLKFHIRNDELFIQLATQISCLGQIIDKYGWEKRYLRYMDDLTEDFLWLHRNFMVVRKKYPNYSPDR